MEKGANFNYRYADKKTPLLIAIDQENLEMVEYILNYADPNLGNPLGHAIAKGFISIVKMLIERGAHLEGSMLTAATYGNVKIGRLLRKSGAEVNGKYNPHPRAENETPLMRAERYNHAKFAKMLVEYGAFM